MKRNFIAATPKTPPTGRLGSWRLRLFGAFALATLGAGLTACTPAGAVIGVGAGTAVAASEERGIGGALSDNKIRAQINYLWFDYEPKLHHAIGLSIYEGRVLLTGVAESDEKRNQAVKLAWKAGGVKEVINEIIVDASGKTGSYASDTWIATQLDSKLLFDKNIYGINYSVTVVRGTIYLLGVAQSKEELGRVLDHARNLQYVRRVVNHVLLKDDKRRKTQ